MSGDVRVEDAGGGQVLPRMFATDQWDETVLAATEAAHGGVGLAEDLRSYLADEIANGFGCDGRHRMAVEALPVAESGGVRVLVLGTPDLVGDDDHVGVGDHAGDLSDCPTTDNLRLADNSDTFDNSGGGRADNSDTFDNSGGGRADNSDTFDNSDNSTKLSVVGEGWPEIRPLDPERTPDAPLDALPPPFREMVRAVSESVQTDPGIPMTFGFGVLSAAVGSAAVKVRQGWVEPVGLYVGVVAGPGEGKSPALSRMAAPLYAIEREKQDKASVGVATLSSQYEVKRRRLDDAKAKAGKSGLDDTERATRDVEVDRCAKDLDGASPPERPRLVVGDITPERLATLAAGQGGRLALIADEAGVLGGMLGRYSGGMASIDTVLSGWSGQPITVDRKGEPSTVRIDRPAFTMALGFQPSLFESIAGNDQVKGRGFIERNLLCWPVSRLGRRAADAPDLADEVCRDWERMVCGAFQELPEPALKATSVDPIIFSLSGDASAELRRLHDLIEPRMSPDGDLVPLVGTAAKMVGQGARLAGVLHVAGLGLAAARVEAISGETMRAAVRLALYFVEHARIGMARAAGARDPAAAVLDMIRRGRLAVFKLRDVQRALGGRAEAWLPVLDRLAEHGYIRSLPGAQKNSRDYEVNPAVLDGGDDE